jgi:hypothetical protein
MNIKMNESFLWNAWKQTEKRNNTLQKDRNSMIPGCETDILGSEYVTNTQPDTIIHKTQTDINV